MTPILSDEQQFLRESARGILSRTTTLHDARAALEHRLVREIWPAAVDAGWPGLLVSEDNGGVGLGASDAVLVMEECGRVLAKVPLLGLWPAIALLQAADDSILSEVAEGTLRATWLPTRPPCDLITEWTVAGSGECSRLTPPRAVTDGQSVSFTGEAAWVPDAPGADLIVVVGADADGCPVAGVVEANNGTIVPLSSFDASRSVGAVSLIDAPARRLDIDAADISRAWFLAQLLLAAESLGTVETALDMAVEYAKQRFTFGRAIGSYQAVKHGLTEVLRRQENARSLLDYAARAFDDHSRDLALMASAARAAAGAALDVASRQNIATHGGIGTTWEHDAPLLFRRSQVQRRLLGGDVDATDRVAAELIASARHAEW